LNFIDDAQTLLHLGLTSSQAKVYLALLRLATDNKGTTIAKFADVPRQDVYRLLAELQQIGIVQKTLARPATFRCVPPEETVSILLERRISDFSQLKKEADKFVKNIKLTSPEQLPPPENDQFILISEREALTCKAREAIENLKESLNDITPFNELVPWLTVLSKSVEGALSRGVKISWITEEPADSSSLSKFLQTHSEYRNFDIRFVSTPLRVKIGIFDGKEVILGINTSSGFALSPALWSNNPSFATMAECYFECCWKRGRDPKMERINPLKNA
jgi:sugar-specific transcriptional regulator TrmB